MPVRNGVLTNRLATIRAVGTHHAIRLVRVLASQSLERWSGSGSRRPRDNRKPFTKHVRLHLPRTRSGHEGVHDAVQPTRNDSGAVFEQTAEALRYALRARVYFLGKIWRKRPDPMSSVKGIGEANRLAPVGHSLGNILSGGFEPGGLIERIKAMIFQSWSEVFMV